MTIQEIANTVATTQNLMMQIDEELWNPMCEALVKVLADEDEEVVWRAMESRDWEGIEWDSAKKIRHYVQGPIS
jgi:hypothetical protein